MTTEASDEERVEVSRAFTQEVLALGIGSGSTVRATRDGRRQMTMFSLSEQEVKELKRLAKKHSTRNVTIELRYLSIMTEVSVE